MGYKPTLGGLKKAQEFLKLKGHPTMPIFQMNIYDDGKLVGLRWAPGKGRTISIDKAIRKYGAMCEMVDVRLTNKQGDKFIQFSSTTRVGLYTGIRAKENGWDVMIEFHYKFKDFMDSNDGKAFVNLARWGKATVSMIDRLKFRFFPKQYATEVFA